MKTEEGNKVHLKAYTIRELAEIYRVSNKIMRHWIDLFAEEIGQRCGHYYTPKQAKIIFTKLGIPEVVVLG